FLSIFYLPFTVSINSNSSMLIGNNDKHYYITDHPDNVRLKYITSYDDEINYLVFDYNDKTYVNNIDNKYQSLFKTYINSTIFEKNVRYIQKNNTLYRFYLDSSSRIYNSLNIRIITYQEKYIYSYIIYISNVDKGTDYSFINYNNSFLISYIKNKYIHVFNLTNNNIIYKKKLLVDFITIPIIGYNNILYFLTNTNLIYFNILDYNLIYKLPLKQYLKYDNLYTKKYKVLNINDPILIIRELDENNVDNCIIINFNKTIPTKITKIIDSEFINVKYVMTINDTILFYSVNNEIYQVLSFKSRI